MPANVETAVYANTPAWHREGLVIDTKGDKGLSIADALPLSGLDWLVEKQEIFLADGTKVQDRWATVRNTDNKPFGVVGKTWTPVQNHEGFAIVDDVIALAGGKCWIEAAGSLNGGKTVWVLAHLDQDMQIAGEKYCSYLLFTNGHDGRMSVTACAVDIRVVCSNTQEWALSEAGKTGKIVRVRHTIKAAERIQEAMQVLGMRNTASEQLAKQGEWLVDQEMPDAQFATFLESLMPITDEQKGKPAATMIGKKRDKISGLYFDAETCKPLKGTRWGAFQAVTEFADFGREFKNQESQLKAQFAINQPGNVKLRALDILMQPGKLVVPA